MMKYLQVFSQAKLGMSFCHEFIMLLFPASQTKPLQLHEKNVSRGIYVIQSSKNDCAMNKDNFLENT